MISGGVGIILVVTAGACSTNARLADLRTDMNARFADLRTDMNARFAQASEQRRAEHRQIEEQLDRIIDLAERRADQIPAADQPPDQPR